MTDGVYDNLPLFSKNYKKSPVRFPLEQGTLTITTIHKISPSDGGVYDNLGLEALYKIGQGLDEEIDFLAVSDASAPLSFHKYNKRASLTNVKRLLNIASHQVYALRSREFRANSIKNNKGIILQIGEPARHYPTTLRTPGRADFAMILHNGYEVARANFTAAALK
jgi:hypothetical protein